MMEIQVPASAQRAMERLKGSGFEAWLVGGCVRDSFRNVAPHDWDLCTDAPAAEVERVFAAERVIETGLKHGTVTILLDGEPLEISTLRGRNLQEDLSHRDFSMNAMAWNPEQGLTDPFGGAESLQKGILRSAGDPDERLKEDPLRLLRALRFCAVMDLKMDPGLEGAMARHCTELKCVASERIRTELEKLLCAGGAVNVLRRYRDIPASVIPQLRPMFDFDQHNRHHCHDLWEHTLHVLEMVSPTPVLRWAALFHDMGKPCCFTVGADGQGHFYGHAAVSVQLADEIMGQLRFDNASRERIALLVREHDTMPECRGKAVRRTLRRLGEDAFWELLELRRADILGQSPESADRLADCDELERMAREILESRPVFSRSELAVNGNDLIAIGFRGAEIREALERLVDAVLCEEVPNTRDALLGYLTYPENGSVGNRQERD